MKVLIVEDEELLATSLSTVLERKGYATTTVYDGESGCSYALSNVFDLLILDVMLPGMDGFEIARRVRNSHLSVPILMLTAKSELDDRIEGLNAGADYYLTKPFNIRELLACVHALLRRQGDQVNQLTFGNTILDLSSCLLACNDKNVRLTAKEFDVMRLLMQTGSRNIAKDTILSRVWGFNSDAVENHVEVYIGFLRKKLSSIDSNVRIEAVRRIGYHLEAAQ